MIATLLWGLFAVCGLVAAASFWRRGRAGNASAREEKVATGRDCEITGTVSCGGVPCPGLRVELANPHEMPALDTSTDEQGTFRLHTRRDRLVRVVAASGPARVTYERPLHYANSVQMPESFAVTVSAETPAIVDFDLPSPHDLAAVSGAIRSEGATLMEGMVRVYTLPRPGLHQRIESAIGSGGRYTLTHLPVKPVMLEIESGRLSARVLLDISAPGKHTFDIQLTAPRRISGMVTGSGSEDSSFGGAGARWLLDGGFRVFALLGEHPPEALDANELQRHAFPFIARSIHISNSRDGSFSLDNLQPGAYTIKVLVERMQPAGGDHYLGGLVVREAVSVVTLGAEEDILDLTLVPRETPQRRPGPGLV